MFKFIWDDLAPIDTDDFKLRFQSRFGNEIKYYDDGFGPLWIFTNSTGIVGIVRCQKEHDAYSIVEDEFLPVVEPGDLHEAYGFDKLEDYTAAVNDPEKAEKLDLVEGYSYQSNSTGTGVVEHDLNGEALGRLTLNLLKVLEITILITPSDEELFKCLMSKL